MIPSSIFRLTDNVNLDFSTDFPAISEIHCASVFLNVFNPQVCEGQGARFGT